MNLHDIEKPLDSVNKILSFFPVSKPFLLESNAVLKLRSSDGAAQKKIYFLLDGALIGYVGEGDKKQNLGILTSPAIIGIGHLGKLGAICDFESISPCLIDAIDVEQFESVINENGLWKDLFQMTLPSLTAVALRASSSGLQSAYDIVRDSLLYMEQEKAYSLKERYTVVKYLQTFSRLSRSMILKILSELKIGGFIDMENGKLIKINKKLPEKF